MIYLASPYSHEDPKVREDRYEDVCEACVLLAQQHVIVYSPIAMWHPIAAKYNLQKDFSFWEFNDWEMIRICNIFGILTIEGWITSDGIRKEKLIAGMYNKRTIHISLEMCKHCHEIFYNGT